MKVLCLGNATLDRILEVEAIPSEATKYLSSSYEEIGGGIAATAAVAIARLGSDVQLVTRLGFDNNADIIIEDLQKDGVDTVYCRKFEGHASSSAVVHVDRHGERQITVHRDHGIPTDAEWVIEEMLEGVDAVMCDGTWTEGAQKILSLAKEKGIPGVIDADLGAGNLEELVKYGSDIAFSFPAVCQLTGETDARSALLKAAQMTSGTVYVTNGSEGCYWLEAGEIKHLPCFKVDVVDTTGAGDVFHGALAFALGKGQKGEDAVYFANAVAGLKCTQPGGRKGIPTYDQSMEFIKNQ